MQFIHLLQIYHILIIHGHIKLFFFQSSFVQTAKNGYFVQIWAHSKWCLSANVDSQSECKHGLESRKKCLYLQPLVGIPL